MIRRRLKVQYLFLFIGILLLLPLLITVSFVKTNLNDDIIVEEEYIPEDVIEDYIPVVNTSKRVINPYANQNVSIAKTYYDYTADEESQLKSILLHEDTYMQNTGIDYIGEESFEVIAILEGTVTSVKDDETVGKTVEISHDNGLVSIYQSLKEVNVKKGDLISQGQILGMSGTNELEKDLGNHLHFEIHANGQAVNPNNYLNKEISVEKGN